MDEQAVNPWQHIYTHILAGIGLGIGATLVGLIFYYVLGIRPR